MKLKLTISEGADPNYLPTVVKVPVIKDHPNADRLSLVEVFGNTIIIGKGSYTEGDLVVYFPVECAISLKFLSWANLRDNPELNADGKTKGFFGKHGRVKAIGLRSIPSQGFLFKVSELAKYYEVDEDTFKLGDVFDKVGEDVLAKKYVKGDSKASGEANVKKSRVPKWVEKTISVMPRPIRVKLYKPINAWFNRKAEGIKFQIVDGKFSFHGKTEHLGRNIFLVNPDDFISITSKMHGTSAIFANILCKKDFNPIRSILNKFGQNIPDTEYKFVYSSRSVLKNRRDGNYTDDVWGVIASELDGEIPARYTIYGEIVGYTPGGATIQKNYDYGVTKGECEFRVYRITFDLGEKFYEFEWYEIEEFCHEHGLKTVPVYYTGLARDLFPEISMDKDWNDNFLSVMKDTYLDKDCEFCNSGIVNEGIVLRIENNPKRTALKFKSPKFVIKESEARDNNEVDMEEDS